MDGDGDLEGRPFPESGLDGDGAAVQLDDLARDRQAKAGAALLARARIVDLLELVEDLLLVLGRDAGCDAYIAKPYSPRQMLAKVREILG